MYHNPPIDWTWDDVLQALVMLGGITILVIFTLCAISVVATNIIRAQRDRKPPDHNS